ncbi:SAM-dependent methyltransferase [Rhodococcus spongiicola]|uniref:S-adenosyl-L-methionine-dependent methyltransferase n=1 Tax=Rhodococcus spongiicola TaxID=2487352 RepID=A0A3S3DXD3_9NOCA|nr:SAM-dependent methyltransferase [Rhodococcus spongiicola]RVW00381.1 SAM-dependent methyltransferase [Rhodococcus spongiicola]
MNQPRGVGVTAVFVAAARALESARDDRLFNDPWAGEFVRHSGWNPPTDELDDSSRDELATWVAVRTKFLDDFALDSVDTGCGQVVLLGAGLDTRAFRLPWLRQVNVYELDTPDMVDFKAAVLGDTTPEVAVRVVVPVDLREDWPAALRDAGFRSDIPTAWILEGLLLYLPDDAVATLMDGIGKLSAPGSAIGASITNVDPTATMSDAHVVRDTLISREGWLSLLHWNGPEDPVAWFGSHGWRATALPTEELAQRYGRTMPDKSVLTQVRPGVRWLVSAVRNQD